jgi:hypothetical protein
MKGFSVFDSTGALKVTGLQGVQGPAGITLYNDFGNSDESLWIPPGIKGDKGDKGDTGLFIPGNDGEDGLDSYIPGPQGIQGTAGINGMPGIDGEDASEWPLIASGLRYEEGTWTPTISGEGGTSGQVYSIQVGSYTRIGRMVYAQCYVALSTKGTITGAAIIAGLPYKAINTTNLYSSGLVSYFANLATNWSFVSAYFKFDKDFAYLTGVPGTQATGVTQLVTTDLNNNSEFIVNVIYPAQ